MEGELIREVVRPQACEECGGTHMTNPIRLGPAAMTWPTVLCANQECVAYGHEMSMLRPGGTG
jgi:hypothetical protein